MCLDVRKGTIGAWLRDVFVAMDRYVIAFFWLALISGLE